MSLVLVDGVYRPKCVCVVGGMLRDVTVSDDEEKFVFFFVSH